MFGLSSTPPPAMASPSDFVGVGALVSLITNADAARARLAELSAATEEARQAIAEATAARAALDAQKAAHGTALDSETEEHRRRIERERTQHNEKCEARERALGQREAAMREAETALQGEKEKTAALKTDLETRLARLRAATAP